MTKKNFQPVMQEIFLHEGGYVNHPRDPGGATNYGITHKTLAAWRGVKAVGPAGVKALTKTEAKKIYRKNYWNEVRGDDLPAGLDLVAMDGAVNSGTRRGSRWLQQGLGVKADGYVGPATVKAARSASVEAIERACAARMTFLQGLRHWASFGKGWTRRVTRVEAVATRMWLEASEDAGARDKLRSLAEEAEDRAKIVKRAGKTQATAAGMGAGASIPVLPDWALLAAIGVGVLAIGFVLYRSRMKETHQLDRAEAFVEQMGELK